MLNDSLTNSHPYRHSFLTPPNRQKLTKPTRLFLASLNPVLSYSERKHFDIKKHRILTLWNSSRTCPIKFAAFHLFGFFKIKPTQSGPSIYLIALFAEDQLLNQPLCCFCFFFISLQILHGLGEEDQDSGQRKNVSLYPEQSLGK